MAELKTLKYLVTNKEIRPTTVNPRAPFITSTLQQAASTKLGFGIKRTMGLAQYLYEAGYITYMRTDSTNISNDALTEVRKLIKKNYGAEYLPEKANYYASKSNAQEAHEAIRPSYVELTSHDLKGIDLAALKLYDLIRTQFMACQMTAS